MEIKKVPISEVEVWKENPRNIKTKDFERLKKQIQELGVYKPLICFRENGRYVTLGGNMRLRVLRELKHRDIDISIVKAKTEAMKIKYALSDNDRVGIYMEQELAELVYPYLEEINLEDFKVDVGEPIELKDIIEDYAPNLDGTEDEVPEIDDSPAITKTGDLFQLGKHRLLCGDATKEEDVKRLTGGEKADMVFTDPPYGIDYSGGRTQVVAKKSYGKMQGDESKDISKFIKVALKIADDKDFYICLSPINLKIALNLIPKYEGIIVWKKQTPGLGYQWVRRYCEFIIFNTNKKKKKTDHSLFDFWDIPTDPKILYEHGTQKPVKLSSIAISFSSSLKDIVMDIFMGSGSTLIACEKLNRICYGMEIEPKYCDVIITRYANFTGTPEEEIRATRE